MCINGSSCKQIKYGTNDLAIILVVLVFGLDRNTRHMDAFSLYSCCNLEWLILKKLLCRY